MFVRTNRNSIGGGNESKYGQCSLISDSGISDSFIDKENTEKMPLLERLLQYKESESEIFKDSIRHDVDTDSISVLEFPFSDDEEIQMHQVIESNKSEKDLTDDDCQFSKEYLEVLEEINAEKGPLSLPCSTCSECSTCSSDTLELMQMTDDCLTTGPTPLDPETVLDLKKIHNEHSELLNELLSKVNLHDKDDSATEDEAEGIEMEEPEDSRDIDEERSLRSSTSSKAKLKKKKMSNRKDSDEFGGWQALMPDDDFFITPPNYDYYRDPNSRDIRFQKDTIPWNVKERSRNKCADWLKSYHY